MGLIGNFRGEDRIQAKLLTVMGVRGSSMSQASDTLA